MVTLKRVLIFCVAVVAAGLLILVGFFTLAGGVGLPVRWEVPPGYKGWVVLRHQDPSCPPIERQGFFLVIKVSQDGTACTSSPRLPVKWRYEVVEYVHADGSRMKVMSPWGDSEYLPGGGILERRFIGTEAEFKQSGHSGYTRSPTRRNEGDGGKSNSSEGSRGR